MNEIKVSILRRDGRTNYEMQYRDPQSGRKIRRTTGHAKKRDALKIAGEWERDLRNGIFKRAEKTLWEDFRQRYQDEVLPGLDDDTGLKVCGVFNAVERLVKPRLLAEVNGDALSTYVSGLRDGEYEMVDGKRKLIHAGRAESTIRGHLAHLRSALSWAVDVGMLAKLPKFPKIQRAKGSKVMKGRPITVEEFDRLLAAVPRRWLNDRKNEFGQTLPVEELEANATDQQREVIRSWRHLLNGLWLSGLRLSESLDLHWSDRKRLHVDFEGKHPMFRVPASIDKANEDRFLPMAPEFAEWLAETPGEHRTGFVFTPMGIRPNTKKRLTMMYVSKVITKIGELAGVKVNTTDAGAIKYASAHDLRRSFGERWASKVMPAVLQQLMRHEAIETTMKYYVGRNAQSTANVLWDVHNATSAQHLGTILGAKAETKRSE